MVQPDHPEEISRLYSGEPAKTWFTKQALNLTTLFMKWAPKPSKKEKARDGQSIRKIVREHWDRLREVVLSH
jgi:hypothetical protein